MAYSVVVINKAMAKDVSSLNRSAECATAMENGFLGSVSVQSTTAGESEVWTFTQPATATLAAMWMVYSPEISIVVNGTKTYRGLSNDPQDFYIPAGYTFDIFKPQVGDIITVTADALLGSKSTNTYVVAVNGAWGLTWNSAAINGLSFKLLEETYLSIPDGAIGTQRVTAYKFECVAVA